MAGVPLYTVKEMVGHSRINTTLRYAHLAPKHTKEMSGKRLTNDADLLLTSLYFKTKKGHEIFFVTPCFLEYPGPDSNRHDQ